MTCKHCGAQEGVEPCHWTDGLPPERVYMGFDPPCEIDAQNARESAREAGFAFWLVFAPVLGLFFCAAKLLEGCYGP